MEVLTIQIYLMLSLTDGVWEIRYCTALCYTDLNCTLTIGCIISYYPLLVMYSKVECIKFQLYDTVLLSFRLSSIVIQSDSLFTNDLMSISFLMLWVLCSCLHRFLGVYSIEVNCIQDKCLRTYSQGMSSLLGWLPQANLLGFWTILK